jgi:hypothetical protein
MAATNSEQRRVLLNAVTFSAWGSDPYGSDVLICFSKGSTLYFYEISNRSDHPDDEGNVITGIWRGMCTKGADKYHLLNWDPCDVVPMLVRGHGICGMSCPIGCGWRSMDEFIEIGFADLMNHSDSGLIIECIGFTDKCGTYDSSIFNSVVYRAGEFVSPKLYM